MYLLELSEKDKQAYSNFIAANESGSFLQSWEWGEWQKILGREAYRFAISTNYSTNYSGNELQAAVQLIRIPLPFGKYYLYAPYGPVLAAGENSQFPTSNFQTILNELKSKFSTAVFIRIEPKFPLLTTDYKLLTKSSNIQPAGTLLIDLNKSEEELLAVMHSKTRYNIRLAEKHGVEVQKEFAVSAGHGLYFKEAIDLVVDTAKRQGFKTFPRIYYEKFMDFFALHNKGEIKVHLYKAVYKGALLASAIMVDFSTGGGSAFGGGTRTYLFGGSSLEQKQVMAPYLLHFRAMMDAKSAGLKFYDFWGTETAGGKTPGFVRFKKGFGGTEKKYAGAYDVILHPFLYKLYRLLRFFNRILK